MSFGIYAQRGVIDPRPADPEQFALTAHAQVFLPVRESRPLLGIPSWPHFFQASPPPWLFAGDTLLIMYDY